MTVYVYEEGKADSRVSFVPRGVGRDSTNWIGDRPRV